jgi:hypothetical protein
MWTYDNLLVAPFKSTSDAIFVVFSHTFILFWLRKTAVNVEIFRLSFRVFACAFPMVISSIFVKSFPFPYPHFVLFVLRYFHFHVVYSDTIYTRARWKVLGLAYNRCETRDKRPLGKDSDRSWCHRHITSMIKLFWSQPMDPWPMSMELWAATK